MKSHYNFTAEPEHPLSMHLHEMALKTPATARPAHRPKLADTHPTTRDLVAEMAAVTAFFEENAGWLSAAGIAAAAGLNKATAHRMKQGQQLTDARVDALVLALQQRCFYTHTKIFL